jgi:hypothetical protein
MNGTNSEDHTEPVGELGSRKGIGLRDIEHDVVAIEGGVERRV